MEKHMRTGTILATGSAIALAVGGYYYLSQSGGLSLPPVMNPEGEATDGGVIVERRTVD